MAEQTYALIDNGVVQQLLTTDQDISTMFAPGLRWVAVEASPGIVPGSRYDGANFLPAVIPAAPAIGMSLSDVQADLARLQNALTALAGH